MARPALFTALLLLACSPAVRAATPCAEHSHIDLSDDQRAALLAAPHRLGLVQRPYASTRAALATNEVLAATAYLAGGDVDQVWGELTYRGPDGTRPVVHCVGRLQAGIEWLDCMEAVP